MSAIAPDFLSGRDRYRRIAAERDPSHRAAYDVAGVLLQCNGDGVERHRLCAEHVRKPEAHVTAPQIRLHDGAEGLIGCPARIGVGKRKPEIGLNIRWRKGRRCSRWEHRGHRGRVREESCWRSGPRGDPVVATAPAPVVIVRNGALSDQAQGGQRPDDDDQSPPAGESTRQQSGSSDFRCMHNNAPPCANCNRCRMATVAIWFPLVVLAVFAAEACVAFAAHTFKLVRFRTFDQRNFSMALVRCDLLIDIGSSTDIYAEALKHRGELVGTLLLICASGEHRSRPADVLGTKLRTWRPSIQRPDRWRAVPPVNRTGTTLAEFRSWPDPAFGIAANQQLQRISVNRNVASRERTDWRLAPPTRVTVLRPRS